MFQVWQLCDDDKVRKMVQDITPENVASLGEELLKSRHYFVVKLDPNTDIWE